MRRRGMRNNKTQAGKGMKKFSMIMTVLGIVLLGILGGCADLLKTPLPKGDGGTGRALVRLGGRAEGARTFMPESAEDYAALSYKLIFTPVSGKGVEKTVEAKVGEAAVELEPGSWNLSVTGYKGETALLEGRAQGIEVRSGETTPVSVAMKVKIAGGSGTLRYSVSFPETATQGWLRVYNWEDGSLAQTVDLLVSPTSNAGTKSKSGDLTLSGGYYRLKVDLYTENGALNRSDIAHIYPGQTTAADYAAFTGGDFAAADVQTATSLADVLSGISDLPDGANRVYILDVDNTPGYYFPMEPVSVSHSGGAVTIAIDGGGGAFGLEGKGSLITIGNGVRLKLKNITLRGRGINVQKENDTPLIQVNTGGTLELNDGVLITGNENIDSGKESTGGVYVEGNGTLTMNGGEISGNFAHSGAMGGGGVYVADSGTFTMNNGKISGNTAYGGGGLYVAGGTATQFEGMYDGGGTFTMNGGEISDNTATAYNGGGVHIEAGGTFTMNNGKISGNKASHGGGVSVEDGGLFSVHMYGGEISGNKASSGGGVYIKGGTFSMGSGIISGNTAGSGGGVYVWDGTFSMGSGIISGNTASSSSGGGVYVWDGTFSMGSTGIISGNTASSSGGGVYVDDGTFTMNGKISDNTASSGGGAYVDGGTFTMSGEILGNTASSGGGVYVDGGTFTKKNGTIYGDTDKTAGNGDPTDNTATTGKGHAVYLDGSQRRRDTTAGPEVELYAAYRNFTWIFLYYPPAGGYVSTTANWEE
jgi:hypothetical protein